MGLLHYLWSRTAASNATADSNVNWAEGMAPSQVNDSARSMMASLAGYRDDISGAIVTGGTSTAYTVTSYQVFDTLAHMNGQVIAFTPHTTCGATVTLNVDSLGAKPLRPVPSIELKAGDLIQGTPYLCLYNSSDQVFYLHGGVGAYSVPLGSGMDYWGTTAPSSSFALAYGQAISRSTYSSLFTLFSTTYGSGDGSTTFNLPDTRGRVTAKKDNMGGTGAGRLQSANGGLDGTGLGNAGGADTHTLTTAQLASHSHSNSLSDPGHTHSASLTNGFVQTAFNGGSGASGTGNQTSASVSVSSATTGISINNASAGSGAAHPNVQPTIICNYIIRVL